MNGARARGGWGQVWLPDPLPHTRNFSSKSGWWGAPLSLAAYKADNEAGSVPISNGECLL